MRKLKPVTRKEKRRMNANTDLKKMASKAIRATRKRQLAQNDIRDTISTFKRVKDEANHPFIEVFNGLKGVRDYMPIRSNSRSRSHSLPRPTFVDLKQIKKIETIKNQKRIEKLINGNNLNVLGKLKGHYNPKSKKLLHRVDIERPLKEIPRPNKRGHESVLERTLWK